MHCVCEIDARRRDSEGLKIEQPISVESRWKEKKNFYMLIPFFIPNPKHNGRNCRGFLIPKLQILHDGTNIDRQCIYEVLDMNLLWIIIIILNQNYIYLIMYLFSYSHMITHIEKRLLIPILCPSNPFWSRFNVKYFFLISNKSVLERRQMPILNQISISLHVLQSFNTVCLGWVL